MSEKKGGDSVSRFLKTSGSSQEKKPLTVGMKESSAEKTKEFHRKNRIEK